MSNSSEDLMSKRISVVLTDEIADIFERLAEQERRSQSQMGAILIEEALRNRYPQIADSPTPTEPPPLPKGKRGKGKEG